MQRQSSYPGPPNPPETQASIADLAVTQTPGSGGIAKRREGLIGTPVDVFANYRPDLSRGASWRVAGARFFVVTMTRHDRQTEGVVFQAPDGTRFALRPADTRPHAETMAAEAGPGTTVFAVRPYWGMPDKAWIAADPEFWNVNPMAAAR